MATKFLLAIAALAFASIAFGVLFFALNLDDHDSLDRRIDLVADHVAFGGYVRNRTLVGITQDIVGSTNGLSAIA